MSILSLLQTQKFAFLDYNYKANIKTPKKEKFKMDRKELERFISAPSPRKRENKTETKEEIQDFHRTSLMNQLFTNSRYKFFTEDKWTYGPFKSYLAEVRIIKDESQTGEEGYVVPHIEDHDQYQVFFGELDQPDSLTVQITLENQKFTVKSPFIAYYPKGLKHAEHVIVGSGWFQSVHLAKHCIYYGEFSRSCPVEIGKEYEVKIEEKSRQGQGIASSASQKSCF